MTITVQDIPLDKLVIAFHSDAGFANAAANKTQAGCVLVFVDKRLDQDLPSKWSLFAWKRYKLPRVVASTLAGETQAFATASGTAEWVSLMIAEVRLGEVDLRNPPDLEHHPQIIGITDCARAFMMLPCLFRPPPNLMISGLL